MALAFRAENSRKALYYNNVDFALNPRYSGVKM